MVEHAVDDDVDAAFVHFMHELEEQLVGLGPDPRRGIVRDFGGHQPAVARGVGTKIRVDVVTGAAVVFVMGGRFEHRVQIDCADAEVLKVTELADDTLKVAPVAAPLQIEPDIMSVFVFPGLQPVPVGCPRMGTQRGCMIVGPRPFLIGRNRIVRGIAVEKTLRENLVPDDAPGPVGNGCVLGIIHRTNYSLR